MFWDSKELRCVIPFESQLLVSGLALDIPNSVPWMMDSIIFNVLKLGTLPKYSILWVQD
jgi:hypothetical protein